MPRKSSKASIPQRNHKYSLRVTMKKVEYGSDSTEESGEDVPDSSEPELKPKMVLSTDSEEEQPNDFLQRRAKNIRDNKAMLAKLMAELEKLPGNLQPQYSEKAGSAQKRKHAASRATLPNHNYMHDSKPKKNKRRPRESLPQVEPRKNPERASRRLTRSMGVALPSPDKDNSQSLEDQLLEVHEPTSRRRSFRPSVLSIPHVVRPVEEITETDLKNIADNVKEKVYDTANGSTCHQCRQKTKDTKTNCRNVDCRGIQGQFCGPCLRNRYGEDVRKALLDPNWTCPPCREICNCSFCRQREGRCATGILYPLARYHGYGDVHSYLNSLHKKYEEDDEAHTA